MREFLEYYHGFKIPGQPVEAHEALKILFHSTGPDPFRAFLIMRQGHV